MKDFTPILWIAAVGAVLYYAYQNNWFGTSTAAAIPAVTSSPNLVPIGTLTPPQPAPAIVPTAPLNPNLPPNGPMLDPIMRFTCPSNADCIQPIRAVVM